MRCLIVDDDQSPREMMHMMISRSGHKATSVDCAGAALLEATRARFDVAIVDLGLGDESGTRTITELLEQDPHLRILVVSGYEDPTHVLGALEAGASGYLLKDEVADSLASFLQSLRAGHTPLSPRVAGVVVRKLRKNLAAGTMQLGRVRTGDPHSR